MNTEPIHINLTYGNLVITTSYHGDITGLGQFIKAIDANVPEQFKPDPYKTNGVPGSSAKTIVIPVTWIERGVDKGKEFTKVGGGEFQTHGIHLYHDSCVDRAEVLPKLTGFKRWGGENVSKLDAIIEMKDNGQPKKVLELRWRVTPDAAIPF